MLTITFKCDTCDFMQTTECKHGYVIPTYPDNDICQYCRTAAVNMFKQSKKDGPANCTCRLGAPHYAHRINCPLMKNLL